MKIAIQNTFKRTHRVLIIEDNSYTEKIFEGVPERQTFMARLGKDFTPLYWVIGGPVPHKNREEILKTLSDLGVNTVEIDGNLGWYAHEEKLGKINAFTKLRAKKEIHPWWNVNQK